MTTLYDPAKVRALAEAGDPFWKGAAWILDQQDAAWQMQRRLNAMGEALDQATIRYAFPSRRPNWDDDWTPIASPNTRSTGE